MTSPADRLYAQIVARARAAAGEGATTRTGSARRTDDGATGLDRRESDTPCGMCKTGWAVVDLLTRQMGGDPVPACPRCAERTRIHHARLPHLGTVAARPRPDVYGR